MKLLMTLVLFMSFNIFADDRCVTPEFPHRTYLIKGHFPDFKLVVTNSIKDPWSCRSRWGCDVTDEVIYQEDMKGTDWQGEMVYQGRRGQITFPSPDDVTYTYTEKLSNGVFVKKTLKLNCE